MDLARVPDGMARDTAWGARSVFRRMARQAGRSKARVISWMARLAGGSTALRRARQRLFRIYVRPLVIMMGINTERPSAFEATVSHCNPHVRFDERGWEMGRCHSPELPRPSSSLPSRGTATNPQDSNHISSRR